jgi:hypothetical protein
MPTFQLVTHDGGQLGNVELGRPDWPVGSVVYRGDAPNLRVLEWREATDADADAILVDEEVEIGS